jgi:chaperonin GroES
MGTIVKPQRDFVVIRPKSETTRTASGLELPSVQEGSMHREGEVLAVGPGKWNEFRGEHDPMPLKPGMRVLFRRMPQTDFRVGENSYVMIIADDVEAIIEGRD